MTNFVRDVISVGKREKDLNLNCIIMNCNLNHLNPTLSVNR